MAVNHTITAINSTLTLIASNPWVNNTLSDASDLGTTLTQSVSSLIGVPFELEGITNDNSIEFMQQEMTETQTDMKGNLYGGQLATASILEFTINFIAASESLTIMQSFAQLMSAQRETLKFSGTFIMPSQGKLFTLDTGYWLNWQSIPSHHRTLATVPCRFRFSATVQTSGY